jgi:HD-GYP domain-containing protein (c-di-GMP phosphodiesterase class II)
MALTHPDSAQEFAARIEQYDRWMQSLLKMDADVGLYLLFQLATRSPAGYSASHALVCAVLCQLIAKDFALPEVQRNSLVRAALTMNVSMTVMQDQLATQRARPSPEQQTAIQTHAASSAQLLVAKGITDELWLKIVERHHSDDPAHQRLIKMDAPSLLALILQVVDRYAAMISPRQSREGRSATDSAQSIVQGGPGQGNAVGQSLVRVVGLCPPGTFVKLDSGEVAVVTRRTASLNLPDVAVVLDQKGNVIRSPKLHPTASGQFRIQTALPGTAVQERINHHLILQLDSQLV